MSDKTGIEWTEAWHAITAAKRIGIAVGEYVARRNNGEKWCQRCKQWHHLHAFGVDATRGDGRASACLASKRVKQRALQLQQRRSGWLKATRDGDKDQARHRVNYLVATGRMPDPNDIPCMDCADEVYLDTYRHEYDHARGYDGENQIYVEVVCSRCHHNREEARRNDAGRLLDGVLHDQYPEARA